jgi:hypothetical protein
MIYQDVAYSATDGLVIGDGVQTESVIPAPATAYKRGDLVAIAALTNVATHGTTGDFNAIIIEDVTAEQADAAILAGFEIPVYTQGEFNVLQTSLNGVKVTTANAAAARGRANTATSLELRMPFGTGA